MLRVSILTIGNELLNGNVVNTNAFEIGNMLSEIGVVPEIGMTVKDTKYDIIHAINYLTESSDIIISTGGLGPTGDDITKQTISQYFGTKLVKDKKQIEKIKKFYKKIVRNKIGANILQQAYIPEGAAVIENDNGTAPGIKIDFDEKTIIMLPGPPNEVIPMVKNSVLTIIKSKLKNKYYIEKICITGLPESVVENIIEEIIEQDKEITIAYCASIYGVKIFLTSCNKDLLEKNKVKIYKRLEKNILMYGDTLEYEIFSLLKNKNLTLSTAESCTGGLISKLITDIAGSSEIYKGSIISYSNGIKEKILNVSNEILDKEGAVSESCVQEMLENVCKKLETETAIAISGIAGPGGGTKEKPLGLVFIGTKVLKKTVVKKYHFTGNREKIRSRAAATALNQLRILLNNY